MKQRATMTFLLFTVLLDTMGISIVMPVMPRLLESITHLNANTVARQGGVLLFVYAIAQFFTSPILGNLSDRFGRRPILLSALVAYALDYLCMGFAPTVAWLFVGRFIAGAVGATMVTINAYAADITAPEKRAGAFGLIGATFGAGFILGPVVGGTLGAIDVRAPFFGAAALALVNVIYGYFILPESLPIERRRTLSPEQMHPFRSFAELRKRPQIRGLLFAYFFQQLSFSVFPSTWAYYCAWRFGWSPALIGGSLAVSGIFMMLVQGVFVGRIVASIGERRTILLGTAVSTAVFLGYGTADHTWMIFALIVFGSLMFCVNPALSALLSQRTPVQEQGAVQGLVASVMGLTMIIGPVFATQLFAAFSAANAPIQIPGIAFFCASAMMFISGAVTWFSTADLSRKNRQALS